MDWQPLTSSNLDACRYDEAAGKLEVRFKSGRETSYANVPRDVYAALTSAPSPGTFFHKNIKGRFRGDAAAGEVSDGRRNPAA